MNWYTAGPTWGSLAVGLYLIIRAVIDWWPRRSKGGIDWPQAAKDAAPFLLSYAYGMLVILGAGGVIGLVANTVVLGVGWVGDGAFVYGVGGSVEGVGIVNGERMALTNGGLLIVLLATAVFIGVRLRVGKKSFTGTAMGRGVLSGILTGTVASFSTFMAIPLASAANAAGAWANGVGA